MEHNDPFLSPFIPRIEDVALNLIIKARSAS